jgi:hypothetical protein
MPPRWALCIASNQAWRLGAARSPAGSRASLAGPLGLRGARRNDVNDPKSSSTLARPNHLSTIMGARSAAEERSLKRCHAVDRAENGFRHGFCLRKVAANIEVSRPYVFASIIPLVVCDFGGLAFLRLDRRLLARGRRVCTECSGGRALSPNSRSEPSVCLCAQARCRASSGIKAARSQYAAWLAIAAQVMEAWSDAYQNGVTFTAANCSAKVHISVASAS